jgi:hypothetical protein
MDDVVELQEPLLSEIVDLSFVLGFTEGTQDINNDPRSFVIQPIYKNADKTGSVVGFVVAIESWTNFFKNALPTGIDGFVIDVKDTCGNDYTFLVNGPYVIFAGNGDLHDPVYDDLALEKVFQPFATRGAAFDDRHCQYTLIVYPSDSFENRFLTSDPYLYASMVLLLFGIAGSVFGLYDYFVQRRQDKVLNAATRTTKIVQSLFPAQIGERILKQAELEENMQRNQTSKSPFRAKSNMQDFLFENQEEEEEGGITDEPIADFFPETTIMVSTDSSDFARLNFGPLTCVIFSAGSLPILLVRPSTTFDSPSAQTLQTSRSPNLFAFVSICRIHGLVECSRAETGKYGYMILAVRKSFSF